MPHLTYFIYHFPLYLILSVLSNSQLAIARNNGKFSKSQNVESSGVILLLSQSLTLQNCHSIHMKWDKLSQQGLRTLLKSTATHSISSLFWVSPSLSLSFFFLKSRITSLRHSGVNYFYALTLLWKWLKAALLEIHFDLLQWMRGKVKELLHN